LRTISEVNPLTYQVDALRALMVIGGTSIYGVEVDLAVLVVATIFMVMVAARLYPRIVV